MHATPTASKARILEETPTPRWAGKRFLLAEDSMALRRWIGLALHKTGASVSTVTNGREAMDAIHRAGQIGAPFDLVFMDLIMPHLNGYDAVYQLRLEGYQGRIVALIAETRPSRGLPSGPTPAVAKTIATTPKASAMPMDPNSSKGFRPTRSTSIIAGMVARMLMTAVSKLMLKASCSEAPAAFQSTSPK